ncbi:MAG TPA: ABC transporter permease [Bryobacteraceae bacterium]|nr:ABC transporter permease [Bryobacteraceae bacterium]
MRFLVRAILRLFPENFRRNFGPDLLATFDDRWREHASFLLAARTIADLVRSAAAEHLSEFRSLPKPRQGDSLMTILWQDIRFAIRMLARSPGFTWVALATLALGIGVNTAMFSVAHAVLWRSLPYPHPDRLVAAAEVEIKHPDIQWGASYPNFLDWRARTHAFQNLAAILSDQRVLRGGPEPVRVTGAAVGHEFFTVLGVQPIAGRPFTIAEDKAGGTPVIVLSHRMWTQRFNADVALVGRAIVLGQTTFTVLGIMPPAFDFPPQAEYWVPLEQVIPPYFSTGRSVWVLKTIGRLRDSATADDARAEIEGITAQIRNEHPETNRGLTVRAIPLRDQLSSGLRPALLVLLGAVALVLLIACGNLAGLMMARAASRAREIAIRSALGARRHRLIRQLLTEGALLSVAGGLLGIGLAVWATRSIAYLSKDPRLIAVPIDGSVLLFALAVSIATCLLFGVVPAIQSTRLDVGEALKQGGARTGAGPHRAAARQFLVAGEIALCLVLLVCAGLMLRSFLRVLNVDPGFRTEQLLTMRISVPRSYDTVPAIARFYSQLPERLKALPGVTDASAASSLPISGGDGTGDITIEGRAMPPGEAPGAGFQRALPNYFPVMGIPLVRGREFDERDDGTRERVTIINESMARRFWPQEDPIGKRIKIGPPQNAPWLTIVGVVKDIRQVGLDSNIGYATYEPLAQQSWATVQLAVRSSGDPANVTAAVRAELRRLEPALLIDQVQTMTQRIGDSVAPRRLNLVLFSLFAALALVLASVGLYGVVAYSATQRTQEFGIRMALGAEPGDVLRLVLGQGFRLALAGVVLGVGAALFLTRLLTTLLFGIEPTDPLTIAGVALLLTAVALLACWLPAYRATRVAPTVALHWE